MKILILEDNDKKFADVFSVIKTNNMSFNARAKDFYEFIMYINREKYDLVITDLLVPRFSDTTEESDITQDLLQNIRDINCINFSTPVVAITAFDTAAQSNFLNLNKFGICVLTYKEDNISWKDDFIKLVNASRPKPSYDCIIICALEKEAHAYSQIGIEVGDVYEYQGFLVQEIVFKHGNGLIIRTPRMGLVNTAITTSRAIELFKPKVVAMSGICAGIAGKSNIYDIIIPEICHQHDTGKWTSNGFVPELYQVTLDSSLSTKLKALVADSSFKQAVVSSATFEDQTEIPIQKGIGLDFNFKIVPTSSGSAVIASSEMVSSIQEQHRKNEAFEMESYSLYEAARQSPLKPLFFSAKSVVDNGNEHKGDCYHRIACRIAAKTVVEIIERCELLSTVKPKAYL